MEKKEYIEREAVLRRMQKIATEAWKMRIKANVETVWNEAQDVLRFFPAADVRPVVLCRDCKHRDPEDHRCDCGGMERQGCPFPVDDDYFCSYAEKREES